MKQRLLITLVTLLLLLVGVGSAYAGTYASSLRVTDPDSTKPFDGSFVDGSGAKLWFVLNGYADTVKVWVRAGNTRIRSFDPLLNLPAGAYNVLWDGKDDSGKFVMNGRYHFEVFTSDTGNSSANWVQAWENPVYLLTGGGLSSRDVEVVLDPTSPMFGNLILTESSSTYGYARMIVAHANGTLRGEYGRSLFPQNSDFDPWFISIAKNGNQYVSSSALSKIFVFRDSILVNTIQDPKIGSPRGIVAVGDGEPVLFIATGNSVVRRNPTGVVDTIFADANATGYVRDIAVDDSGYVFLSFGASSTTYSKVVRLSKTFAPLDTVILPERVTHLNVFHGANVTSNADDIVYCRVLGANGGVFKLDFATKTSTKLFAPSTSTSSSHSIATDGLGNIYYANPSAEWVRMYIPPMSAPVKMNTIGGLLNVLTPVGTRIVEHFDKNVGRFNQVPTYSGSTVGISTSSTASWTSLHSVSGIGGSVAVTLLDNPSSSVNWEVRLLSAIGVPANNDSLPPFGWVGFWLKTNSAPESATVAIGIDDPADPVTKRSIKVPVINDGEWHLYQWNMADSTQWTPWVVTSGSPKIKGPRASIDAVWFFAKDNSAPWTAWLDNVSHNANGPLGNEAGRGDVTGNGMVSVLDASWILQHVVKLRPFTPMQVQIGDVNLSHNGTAVNAFDAAVVLGHVAGKIPFLPWVQPLPPLNNVNGGDNVPLSLSIASAQGTAGKTVTIPISIPANLAGLRSAEMEISYDPSLITVKNVTSTSLTKDFVIVSNIENGKVRIAMANTEAISMGGQILTLEAEVKQDANSISFTISNILLNDRSISKVTSVGGTIAEVPETYQLLQNYPNPFNPTTTIEYRLPQNGFVELKIYDITGREVKTLVSEQQTAGSYRVVWNGTDSYGSKVSSGVYLYRISAGSFTQIKKMMLLK